MHLIYSRNSETSPALTLDVNGSRYVRPSAYVPFLIVRKADALAATASGEFVEQSPVATLGYPWTDADEVVHERPAPGAVVGEAITNTTTDVLNFWDGLRWVDPEGNPA